MTAVPDYQHPEPPADPEVFCYPAPTVCCEHWSGQGEDGWSECCLCSHNPCDSVTVDKALDHGAYEHWRGRLDGVFLARSALSDQISHAAPADRPDDADTGLAVAVEAFHSCWVIVRGAVDEPPF